MSTTVGQKTSSVLDTPPEAVTPDSSDDPTWSLHGSTGPSSSNLRGHLFRGAVRLVSLVVLDVAIIWGVRVLLRHIRAGLLGADVASFAIELMPLGAVSGAQLAVAFVIANLFLGGYRAGDRWRDPVRILSAAGIGVLLAIYSDLWHGNAGSVAGRGALTWIVLGPMLVGARSLASLAVRRFLKNGLRHRVIEIRGEGSEVDESKDLGPSYQTVIEIDHRELPAHVDAMEPWLGGGVDTILVKGHLSGERIGDITDFALTHGCRLLCMPRTPGLLGIESKRVWMEGHPLSELTAPVLRASHLVLKRTLDIVVSSATLLVLSPLLLAIVVWIRTDSPGPVMFRQKRPGLRGRPFEMLKFRSMRTDAERVLEEQPELYEVFLENDCKLPENQDPRLTRPGRFLRKTSLDELPQLFNVLQGDMSLVGPRPLVGPELHNYRGRVPTLLSVKPGMTGPWQISGRSRVSYPERAEIDLEYVRNWSFLGDIWILALTPWAVFVRRGAH